MQGVTSGSDALSLVKNTYFDLAILDAESSDVPFVPFTRELVAAQPGLKLLVFPPSNNPHHPVLAGLVANGFLKKPFFTPEVSRAFKEIFSEKSEEPPVEPQPITNLAELWMKRPEVGFNRVEQLLGSTTAQTGLLIARGNVIAGSGPIDDATIQQVLNLLDAHKPERASLDIMQFLPIENGEEILVYASQLIPEITLVLFYPPSTSIQLARQEVFQVKNEFKEAYPNTSELRKELAIKNENQTINEPAAPVVEENPVEDLLASIDKPDSADLKPLEDEIGFEDLDTVLSFAELKNLDSMLANMPPPDPGQEGEEDHPEPEPIEDLGLTDWLPLPEEQKSAEISEKTPDETIEPVEISDETPTDFIATEPEIDVPPLPEEFLRQFQEPSQDETEKLEAFPLEKPDVASVKEDASQIPVESVDKEPESEEFNFDFIWDLQKEKPEATTEIQAPLDEAIAEETQEISESQEAVQEQNPLEAVLPNEQEPEIVGEDAFNAWLDELSEKESIRDETTPSMEADDTQLPRPLPVLEPATPELEEEIHPASQETSIEIPQDQEPEPIGLIPLAVASELSEAGDLEAFEEERTIPDEDSGLPPALPQDAFDEDLSSEPGTTPLGVYNFRFHYSYLLIPRSPKQFLTGDIKERLSFILPQLHLEYGWHLTGIAIRPQFLLWSISIPLDTCPIDVIQEIRRRTSAHLFANFPDLNKDENQIDFWAPGFLALSGSSGPSVGMIYDFIKTTRDNQKPGN